MLDRKPYQKYLNITIIVIGLFIAAYHIVYARVLLESTTEHYNTFLICSVVMVFLLQMKNRNMKWWPLYLFMIIVVLACGAYVKIFHYELHTRALVANTTADLVVGVLLVILVLEATRQQYGLVLPLITSLFIVYGYFGHYLQPPFTVTELPIAHLISRCSIGLTGIFNDQILGAVAKFIILFVIFGSLLGVAKAIALFLELGKIPGRKMRGGAAMTAVVSSALLGTVNGSSIANVSITGSITIPAMKRMGYRPENAAAIESAASSSGTLMPPVMGAVAFIMASVTGIPYAKIMVAAALPAILYCVTVGLYVRHQAIKLGIPVVRESIDKLKMVQGLPPFIISLTVIAILLMQGYSPVFAGFWGIVAVVVTTLVTNLITKSSPSLREWMHGFVDGAKMASQIGVAAACVGPIVSIVTVSGIGITIAAWVETLCYGIPVLALVLTALVALLFGCGVPAFIAYVMTALIMGPALSRFGFPLLESHLFILYFSVFATITPPVGLTALVAAGIAGARYMKVAIETVKVALTGWLLPFLFVFAPVLLLKPASGFSSALGLIASLITVLLLPSLLSRYLLAKMDLGETILCFVTIASSVIFILYGGQQAGIFFAVGIASAITLFMKHLATRKRRKSLVEDTWENSGPK